MMPLSVCRVCLVENMNLNDVRNELQNAYERITRETYNKDEYPISVCYICLSTLRKCHRFMETARDSNKWLQQWYNCKGKIQMRVAKPLAIYSVSKVGETSTYNGDIVFDIKQENVEIEVPLEYKSTEHNSYEEIEKLDVDAQTWDNDLLLDSSDYMGAERPPKRRRMMSEQNNDNEYESTEHKGYKDTEKSDVDEQTWDNDLLLDGSDYMGAERSPKTRRMKSEHNNDNDTSQTYLHKGIIEDEPEIYIKEEISETDQASKDTNLINEGADYFVTDDLSHMDHSDIKLKMKPKSKTPHVCDICNQTLSTSYGLKRHITQMHSSLTKSRKGTNEEKLYSCNDCPYESKNRSWFVSHLKIHSEEKPFSCDMCDYICKRKAQLSDHMINHVGGKKTFLCHFCDYKCQRETQLIDHVRTHTGEKPFACQICDFKCKQKVGLNVHMRVHTGERPFSCKMCDFTSKQKGHLDRHMKSHRGIKPFSCTECNYSFVVRGALKVHMRTHTGEKPFTCDICQYRSATKFALQSHKRNVHGDSILLPNTCTFTKTGNLSCDVCGQQFKWQVNLNKHMKRHEKAPLICDLCGYTCKYEGDFKRHARTHTGEKPFSCNICNQKFVQKSQLPIHMRIHSGEKPFLCHLCDHKFPQKQQLDSHLKSHTNDKPFSCDVCNLKFTRKFQLTTHMRTHTGEKPFLCEQCDYRCINKSYLKKHVMRIHK